MARFRSRRGKKRRGRRGRRAATHGHGGLHKRLTDMRIGYRL